MEIQFGNGDGTRKLRQHAKTLPRSTFADICFSYLRVRIGHAGNAAYKPIKAAAKLTTKERSFCGMAHLML